jgi:hypothetical protein
MQLKRTRFESRDDIFTENNNATCAAYTFSLAHWLTLPPSCAVVMKSGNLNFLQPSGPLQACNGTAFYSHAGCTGLTLSAGGKKIPRMGKKVPSTTLPQHTSCASLVSAEKNHVGYFLNSPRMFVCMYVCICVCVYVCLYVCVCVCIMYVCVCMYVCLYVCIMYVLCTHVCM